MIWSVKIREICMTLTILCNSLVDQSAHRKRLQRGPRHPWLPRSQLHWPTYGWDSPISNQKWTWQSLLSPWKDNCWIEFWEQYSPQNEWAGWHQQGVQIILRPRLQPHDYSSCDQEKCAREPQVVHSIHAVSSWDLSGSSRDAPQLLDHDHWADRSTSLKCISSWWRYICSWSNCHGLQYP